MEFLVTMSWTAEAMAHPRWTELLTAEQRIGDDLRSRRVMTRVWTVPGRRQAIALFDVDSIDVLHTTLSSLPLFPFLDMRVEPLASHPMDTSVDGRP